jgi:alpha-1,3-rhamnosyl/mannosyltransferase
MFASYQGHSLHITDIATLVLEEDTDLELLRICNATGGRGRLSAPRVMEVVCPFPPISPDTRYALDAFLRRQHLEVFQAPFAVVPRGLHRPLVVTIHERNGLVHPRYTAPLLLRGWAARAYGRAHLTAAMQKAQRLLAVSQATHRAICAYAPWHNAKVRVPFNGLDTSRISSMDKALAFRLLAPCLPPGTPCVLTVGHGAPSKTHRPAVQGGLEAFRDHPAYRMSRVRRAVHRDKELHARLRHPDVQARVRVLSYGTGDLRNALYHAARIVLPPSYYEGFGLPLLEAMAVGTPLVRSRVSALPEIGGPAAVLVDPAAARAIGAALQTLDRDEALRARLIAAGRQRGQRYGWRACARATRAVYREVA